MAEEIPDFKEDRNRQQDGTDPFVSAVLVDTTGDTNADELEGGAAKAATATAASSSGDHGLRDKLKELKARWNALEPKWRWTTYGTLGVVILVVIIAVAATSGGGDSNNNNNNGGNSKTIADVDLSELSLNAQSTEVPAALLDVALDMLVISRNVYNRPNMTVPDATRYEDGVDAALWVKRDDLCILAFQATTPSLRDWYQNIPIRSPVNITSSATGKKCMTQAGFYNAYYNVDYYEQLKQDVRGCVDSCEDDGGCDLIIIGASQGAAIASVAAVDLDDLAPTLMTFGQPASLFDVGEGEPPCSEVVPMERFFRFMNTVPRFLNTIPLLQDPTDVTVLQYDPVPSLPARFNSTDYLGALLLIGDENTANPLAFYPEGQRELIPPSLIGNFDTHIITSYLAKLEAIRDAFDSGNIPLVGFPDGTLCNFDSECQSASLCFNLTCTPASSLPGPLQEMLEKGERCFRDADCETGACVVTCRDNEYRYACSPSSDFFDISDCLGLLDRLDLFDLW